MSEEINFSIQGATSCPIDVNSTIEDQYVGNSAPNPEHIILAQFQVAEHENGLYQINEDFTLRRLPVIGDPVIQVEAGDFAGKVFQIFRDNRVEWKHGFQPSFIIKFT